MGLECSEQFTKDCTYAWNASNTGCQGGFEGKLYEMLAFNSTQRMAASSKYPYVPKVVFLRFLGIFVWHQFEFNQTLFNL